MQVCMQMEFPSISNSQKVCRQHCASHKLTGQRFPTRLTEVRDFKGLTTKNLSGMLSDIMGLWVCKAARKCNFLQLQNVKDL